MPIRIGYLAAQLNVGGIEKQFYYLLTHLDRRRFEPHVLIVAPPTDEGWEALITRMDVPQHRIHSGGRIARVWQIRRQMASWRVDVIHCLPFYFAPYGVAAALGCSMRVIGSVRSLPTPELLRAHRMGPLLDVAINGPDRVICNTLAAAEMLARRIRHPDRVRVIMNGCEIPSDDVVVERRRVGRRELGLEPDACVIGTIGRLDADKNVSLLLAAAAKLKEQGVGARLVVIGSGPMEAALHREVATCGLAGMVHFTGHRPLAEEIVPALDIVALTSRVEGMPNVLMEAAAAGIPAIATRVGGVPDLIADGETGCLVDPDDATGVADALQVLIADPARRRRFGAAARERIAAHFAVERMVQATEEVYEELCH